MINHQTSSDKFWSDEAGNQIPLSRINSIERLKEKTAFRIAKKAQSLSENLLDFKEEVRKLCEDIYNKHMDETNISVEKRGKGNFTFYNFSQSIKVVVKISDRITFDDLILQSAKAKFDEFVDNNIEGKVEFAKQLVSDAFQTAGGKVDAKKLLGLIRYKQQVKEPSFIEAVSLLESAIRRPDSKTYFQVFVKNGAGEFENINLDFAAL